MRSPEDVKLRAKNLRVFLSELNHDISIGQSLEIMSKLEGYRDWNTLSGSKSAPATPDNLLRIPDGWRVGGDQPQQYEFGRDPSLKHNAHYPAIIRSKSGMLCNGFGTLMQSVKAGKFADKRVSMRAHIKATDCDGAVTIWLRADGVVAGHNIAFDNMEDRIGNKGILTGSTGWEAREIVLDIPLEAATLNFGFYLRGSGIAHASQIELEIVSADRQVTSKFGAPLAEPFNLAFSDDMN